MSHDQGIWGTQFQVISKKKKAKFIETSRTAKF